MQRDYETPPVVKSFDEVDALKSAEQRHRFVFVRHAEAVCNRQSSDTLISSLDPHSPLTVVGKRQAMRLARALPKELVGASVFCSPSRRAIETASCIADKWGLRLIRDRRLEELRMDQPLFPPLTVAAWDALLDARLRTPAQEVLPGVESLLGQRARVLDFLQERHAQRGVERLTLVISHAFTIELAINLLLKGLEFDASAQLQVRISNAALHVIENERLGGPSRLVLINAKHHLGTLL